MLHEQRLLIVTHNLGGGVERHVADLQALFAGVIYTEVLRSVDQTTVSLELPGSPPVFWRFTDWAQLVLALRQRGYDWISLQHVDGFAPQILSLARTLDLPYDLTLHDFYPYCPIYSLSSASGEYCGEPDLSGCGNCTRLRPNRWNWSIERWRNEMGQLLSAATRVTAPSHFVADRVQAHFPEVRPPVWAHPPRAEWLQAVPAITKVLLLGKLSRMKGLDRLVKCAKWSTNHDLGLAFCVVGLIENVISDAQELAIQIRGEYADPDLPQLLALERGDVIWFPGPYPETYCYTLDVAKASGLAIVASDFGAIAERLVGHPGARVLANDASPQAWCEALLAAAGSRADVGMASADSTAANERASYRDRFIAPILARVTRKPTLSELSLMPVEIEIVPHPETQTEPALALMFEHGVECGHLESRLALKNKLAEVDRDYALLGTYAQRNGKPWYEILNLAGVQAEQLAARNAEYERLSREQVAMGCKLMAAANDVQSLRLELDALRLELDAQTQRNLLERARALEQINKFETSTSWRVTAPLRASGRIRNQLQYKAQRLMALFGRVGPRLPMAWNILKSDGPVALLQRIRAKAGAKHFIPTLESAIELVPIGALELGTCAAERTPRISIVIPVYGHDDHTFNCLASIARHTSLHDVEIIVVDDASPTPTEQVLNAVRGVKFLRAASNGGFIESCRLGAANARGEFLVLLNNDVQVTPAWLVQLLQVFELRPDAGMVGARLVYPDGRLQEAGGIVWQDGSAWNWGRGDDPDRPQYQYLRAVDYCSGACLAIRNSDWQLLGGFDKLYAPAYYEDTDLAFRVRQVGKKVYYQPAATIVHFEGVSSGTDETTGVKRHQVINRASFHKRWEAVLKSHQHNGHLPQREVDRDARKRVLIVEACMITPDQDSGSVRMLAMLELLLELQCKVSLIADNLEYRQPYVGQLQQVGVEVWHHPYVQSVAQLLTERGKEYDVIVFCRHYIAAPYMADVRNWAPQARIVFDTVDLHYLREQRLAELEVSQSLQETAQVTRTQELGVIAGADLTLVVSPVEKELLSRELPGAAVEILSNIHELQAVGRPYADREGLIFVGGFRHPPNIDAVNWFVGEVWPLVLQHRVDIKLTIVGSNMPAAIRELAAPNVVVAGFVENIDPLIGSARISIAPLRYGAGVKGKINQAMACGLPVVATDVAAEGMDLHHGEELLVADSPQAFADAVLRLYDDEALWQRLATGGRRNIEKHFSRSVARNVLARVAGVVVPKTVHSDV